MLTYYNRLCGPDVVIPSTVDGKDVTSIYRYTFNNMGLTSIYIPDTVKTIGEGIKTLGQRAFRYNQLTSPVIPESVTTIGSCCSCDNPIPNPSFLYAKTNGVTDYSRIRGYIGNLSEFPDKVFRIPEFVLDENGQSVYLKTIENSAFSRISLTGWEVVIPNTVTSIGSSAFWDSGIAKVTLPSGLKTIGNSAFMNNRITELNIPSSVTTIGNSTFNANRISNNNQAWIYKRTESGIDYSTIISYAGLTRANVDIPSQRNGVNLKAFSTDSLSTLGLTGTIKIPQTVTSIGTNAFRKEISWENFNYQMTKIINKTGRSFDWRAITNDPSPATFETGTIENWYGNIEVVKS